ncbi:hypothetical protein EST38_g1987 [Candolleomyces aberdarensis]|uniref:HAT C-terminal dimerisation domain-containing protein n=1 Tax=Candolleomyces aberdarensis TaxID=2316362 RepID=A0A4Q2DVN1_9AGAR|nr:hypothetical protein EST38_g1987 [Candolleomyces aberdarensis]
MSDSNKRKRQAASKLTNPNNVGDVEVRSHREARERREKEAQEAQSRRRPDSTRLPSSIILSTRFGSVTVEDGDENKSDDAPTDKGARVSKKSQTKTELCGPKGNQKRQRRCLRCKTNEKFIVPEMTTLRRHIQACHPGAYNAWCKRNNFKSKLPAAVRAQKDAVKKQQSTLDDIVVERERFIPYSDARFQEAAEDWLIATDQSDSVGRVSLTCDAWQASNRDAYFAVTGHWIEGEIPGGELKMHSALFGFTQMKTAHDGARLGCALNRIVKRLGIGHKIGWITCDNASNNKMMLAHFEGLLNAQRFWKNVGDWDCETSHIRCLAHIINLATQAVLGAYSKTPHFNPGSIAPLEPDIGVSDDFESVRDVVGLIRCIAVKSRSSAKRNALLKELQEKDGVKIPRTLLVDMKVRWSSTYLMLKRAYELCKYINLFISEISMEETSVDKQNKLLNLRLSNREWERVKEFLGLLKHADQAQQAFSSETEPSLYNGLPALERLHKAWSSRAKKDKYEQYKPALKAGIAKIEEYYDKTSFSHAYTMAMILDPDSKTKYFQKHWGKDLELEVRDSAKQIFEERWTALNKSSTATPLAVSISKSRLDNDGSDDDSISESRAAVASSEQPWLKEYKKYVDGDDEREEGQSMVERWASNSRCLPTWASLARDYLPIMVSSVSSERAFSAAGITISKRRNRLKADIVEALQVLKYLLQKDLVYRTPPYISLWEIENEMIEDDDGSPDWVDIISDIEGDDGGSEI